MMRLNIAEKFRTILNSMYYDYDTARRRYEAYEDQKCGWYIFNLAKCDALKACWIDLLGVLIDPLDVPGEPILIVEKEKE